MKRSWQWIVCLLFACTMLLGTEAYADPHQRGGARFEPGRGRHEFVGRPARGWGHWYRGWHPRYHGYFGLGGSRVIGQPGYAWIDGCWRACPRVWRHFEGHWGRWR